MSFLQVYKELKEANLLSGYNIKIYKYSKLLKNNNKNKYNNKSSDVYSMLVQQQRN